MKFGFLNYARVNDRPDLRQFIYRTESEARQMEDLLSLAQIHCECIFDGQNSKFWLVRVAKKDFEAAYHHNITVKSQHKSALISDPVLRYFLLITLGIALALSIVGAIVS